MESKESEPTTLMMSEFLVLVSADTLTVDSAEQALKLSHQILEHEPNNNLIKEYQKTLGDYIDQEMNEYKDGESDDGESSEGKDDYSDDDDDQSGSEDEESDFKNCRK